MRRGPKEEIRKGQRSVGVCAGEKEREEGRNKNPKLWGWVLQEWMYTCCALQPSCALGSLSETSPVCAASNHQQEVLLHAGAIASHQKLLHKVKKLK